MIKKFVSFSADLMADYKESRCELRLPLSVVLLRRSGVVVDV